MPIIYIKRLLFVLLPIFVLSACNKDGDKKENNAKQRTCPLSSNYVSSTQQNVNNHSSIFESTNQFSKVQLISLQKSNLQKSNLLKSKPQEIKEVIEKDYTLHGVFPFQSEHSVDLGMGTVPVLNQQEFGTCVTFATTAAMNAILGLGDFISQQCSLMLNVALGNNYWDGAYQASEIIEPLQQYGLVSKENCPVDYPHRLSTITTTQYTSFSDPNLTAQNIKHKYFYPITLDQVKKSLNAGHRVLFGFGLLTSSDINGVGGFNAKVSCETKMGGLWACQQPGNLANYCGLATMGHEAIIVGYDDSQEVFKIRNSWGSDVGDNGDFYMTYKFFNEMGIDGTEIY